MYISVLGKGDKARVYLVESFRKDGKVSTRNIKSFGRVSDINKDDPEALNKLKAKYDKSNEVAKRKAKEQQVLDEVLRQDAQSLQLKSKAPLLDYSQLVLMSVWNELGLSKNISNLQNYHESDLSYDLNKVISTLSFLKITDAGSIRKSYSHKANILGASFNGVSLDQLYASLGFLYEHKETILRGINRNLDKKLNRSYSMVYYDVTNAYFESELTDEERGNLRTNLWNEVLELLEEAEKKETITKATKEKIITEINYDLNELPPELKQELKCMMYLRMRGLSKEHRYDLPIISISLVIDDHAIPIDYEIYAGCASEYKTMRQSIEKMKEKYGIKNTIVVADRGLNSTENMEMLLTNKYGFLVAQKVSNLSQKDKKSMLDPTGYKQHVLLKDRAKGLDDKDNVKDIIRTKTIDFVKTDNKGNSVKCKLIFTHSKKREERDLKMIDMAVNEAQKAIQNHKELPISKRSWVSIIKREKGGIQKAAKINEELVNTKRELAGYSGVIYHDVPDKTQNKEEHIITAEDVAHSYHNLVQIEECFRIMKTNLGLRPMYVRLEEHIEGHVLLCVMALIIVRLVQIKLDKAGTPLTIEEIIEGLNNAKVAFLHFNSEKELFVSTSTYTEIYRNHERLTEEELRELLSKQEDTDNISKIMTALGLKTLPFICNKAMIEQCFHVRFTSEWPILDPVVFDLVTGNIKKSEAKL